MVNIGDNRKYCRIKVTCEDRIMELCNLINGTFTRPTVLQCQAPLSTRLYVLVIRYRA